jgi:hypothetical protein
VTVEYLGHTPIGWVCQNYVPKKNLVVRLEPNEKDKFDYDYARRVFGDWEVDPDKAKSAIERREKIKEWNGMMGYTIRRSPSMDGKLPRVKIYDPDGNLLWDAHEQMGKWLEHNAKEKDGFLKAKGVPPGGPVEMPKILADATYAQLKTLWLAKFEHAMPAGIQAGVAKKALMPYLSAEQIEDVLRQEYEAAKQAETAAE